MVNSNIIIVINNEGLPVAFIKTFGAVMGGLT
jgi:hypothetical protein